MVSFCGQCTYTYNKDKVLRMSFNDTNANGSNNCGRRTKKRKSNGNSCVQNSANAPSPSRVNIDRRSNNLTDDTVNSISNYNNNSSGRNTLFNARSTRQAYLQWFILQKEETTLHTAIERIIYFGAAILSWSKLDEIAVRSGMTEAEKLALKNNDNK